MFIPNVRCKVRRRIGTNVYGKGEYGGEENAACGIVRLEESSDTTSVRADSTASRGSAKEENLQARLLFPARTRLNKGDLVKVMSFTMIVQSVWPRHNVTGRLDHWQIDLQILTSGDA